MLILAALLLILGAGVSVLVMSWTRGSFTRPVTSSDSTSALAEFVDNQLCADCHQQQYQEWLDSHHDLAMQEADAETILGNFDDTRFVHRGVMSRFFKKDGRFLVHTEGPGGKMGNYEVTYTFGVEPLQQYLIEFPGGRLQSLSIAWDTKQNRWFHLYPNERISPEDPLHWTGRYQNWNLMCAECHSTNLKKNYDLGTDTYQTTWSAINVSCQACHGPGSVHVAWAGATREGKPRKSTSYSLVVNFKSSDPRYEVNVCAPCHSRRHAVSPDDQHGRPLLDDFMPATLREGLYYPDGQVLEEVYVYGSYLQSKMYHAGVRCSDCHNSHSLKLRTEGNALCGQCHNQQKNPRFPSLTAKNYDTPEHHFHTAGSAGALCVNCHMPARLYMVVDPRRDHSFRVPRPDLSVRINTPNACTLCHTEKSDPWATETVARWYGLQRRQETHYGQVIADGRAEKPEAAATLGALANDPGQVPIVRATALELLRGYGVKGLALMVKATQDPDPLVRATAVGGLDALDPQRKLAAAVALLEDPIRAVRVHAVRQLASVPAAHFSAAQRGAFEKALGEYRDLQTADADWPGAHLNMGVVQAATEKFDEAEQSYLNAIRMDPTFLPARVNLATLYNQSRRNKDAERVLREALERHPKEGELHYSLGLLLAEEERLEEAARALGKAAELLPARPRVHYNYALALQHLGRRAEAEAGLLQAYELNSRDSEIVYALAVFYVQQHHWRHALPYAKKLVELMPDAAGPRRMLGEIVRELEGGSRPR